MWKHCCSQHLADEANRPDDKAVRLCYLPPGCQWPPKMKEEIASSSKNNRSDKLLKVLDTLNLSMTEGAISSGNICVKICSIK
ncbi:hypothetical protein GN956_G1810 [Arapaima gigas]